MLYRIPVISLNIMPEKHVAYLTILGSSSFCKSHPFSQKVSYRAIPLRIDICLRNHICPQKPRKHKGIPFVCLFLGPYDCLKP